MCQNIEFAFDLLWIDLFLSSSTPKWKHGTVYGLTTNFIEIIDLQLKHLKPELLWLAVQAPWLDNTIPPQDQIQSYLNLSLYSSQLGMMRGWRGIVPTHGYSS